MEQQNHHARNSDEENKITTALQKYVSDRLRECRLELNHTLEAVAHDTGISESKLSRMENGLCKIDITAIFVLATHYKKPVDYFYPHTYNIINNILCKIKYFLINTNYCFAYAARLLFGNYIYPALPLYGIKYQSGQMGNVAESEKLLE